jgi:hypothetical protein
VIDVVSQRSVAGVMPARYRGNPDIDAMWLYAVATDGDAAEITYPEDASEQERANTDAFVQGTLSGMKNAGWVFSDDPERWLHELCRHPLGVSTETAEYGTFEAANAAAATQFQTPVDQAFPRPNPESRAS